MRHRGLLTVLAIHLVLLPAFAVSQGWSLASGWAFDIGPATFGGLACWPRLGRAWRSSTCALALLSCSALVVVSWHGMTEAHFHYFVMVGALALYEEWWAYVMAIAFVVLQHGVISFWETGAVFNHDRHAWAWAGIHGLFVAALAVANLISWRANESARTATASSEERFRRAFDAAPVAMALVSPAGALLQTNEELRERIGSDAEHFWDFAPAADREEQQASWPPESDGPEREQRYVGPDGSLGWFVWRHSLIRDGEGRPDHYISQGVDVTARKQDAERLVHQAHHDPLTGLPNRALFDMTLAGALERRQNSNTRLAVLFADIDDFKVINDSLGHRAGDELLVAAAERLTSAVRPGDTIARFGGDEFVILLERIMSLSDLRRIADRVADEIKRPFVLDGRQRFLSASIGIAVADGTDGTDVTAEELLRDADAAMYQAKEHGKAQLEFFDRSVRSRAVERLELEAELRDALTAGQLSLAYQPEVMLSETTRMFGVEALLRWQHPTRGSISPARFIPVAEQSGLIVEIGEWVLSEACRQAAVWRAQGNTDFVMAVNLSPRQLSSPQLASVVAATLRDNALPPSALCLEITESAIMEDPEAAHRILQGLKALGVRLAIDDFGVGYSSLSHLKYLLPVDVIKIDKSFVDGLLESRDARAIITAIIQLAHALGVTAVGEGVETAEQADALRDLGCHVAQGYHFSKPVPADYLLFNHSESLSAASPALSPTLPTPSAPSLKIVRNLSA